MFFFSTEVTSSQITSDSPLFQRTRKAYEIVSKEIYGNVLEIGSGEGYGLKMIYDKCSNVYAIDKSRYSISSLSKKIPNVTVIKNKVPPIKDIKDNSLDFVIAFQVIEHIKKDSFFLKEIHRVLKKDGILFLTTPNSEKTLVRNPWHYKEYNFTELKGMLDGIFQDTQIKGISGDKHVQSYFEKNEKHITNILAIDIFNLIDKLPSWFLKIPYELGNRINRKKLYNRNKNLIAKISTESYFLEECNLNTLDFFCIAKK